MSGCIKGIKTSLLTQCQKFERPSNSTLTLFVVGLLGATTFAIGFAGLGAQASRNWWASGLKNLGEAGSIVMLTGGTTALAALALYLVRDKLPANVSLESLKTLNHSKSKKTENTATLSNSETGVLPKEIEVFLKQVTLLPPEGVFTAFFDNQEKQWFYVTIKNNGTENTLETKVFKDDASTADERYSHVCHGLPMYYDVQPSDFSSERWRCVSGKEFPISDFEAIVIRSLGKNKASDTSKTKKEVICIADFSGNFSIYFSDPDKPAVQKIKIQDSKKVMNEVEIQKQNGCTFLQNVSTLMER